MNCQSGDNGYVRLKSGEDGVHFTFCRICEAFCGLSATVENGRITKIGPDRENPHSRGHLCVKGPTILDVAYDPDRVTQPLRRCGEAGVFEAVSWDDALGDIAQRLSRVTTDHGVEAAAAYVGNPSAFSAAKVLGLNSVLGDLGFGKRFSAASQDSNPRHVASFFLYGSAMRLPIPDLPRADFLIIFGGNPLVSHGSILTAPRIREDLDDIARRGRVIVVDPRATETAKRFEHVAIRPDTDAWLLGAIINIMFQQGLADEEFLAAHTNGWTDLRSAVATISPEAASLVCGIEADQIIEIATAFGAAKSGCAYSRVGLCRGQFSTLATFLIDALNIVAGKFGRAGGWVFGDSPLDPGAAKGGYDPPSSRIAPLPVVTGNLPTILLPDEILEDGNDRIRALVVTAGNPVLSAPGGAQWPKALTALELFVSLDLYVTETNRFAHYILPSTTFLEREDVPVLGWSHMIRPYAQYTDAVIPPVGSSRSEMDVLRDLAARIAVLDCGTEPPPDRAPHVEPMELLDKLLRRSAVGDQYGANPEGLSMDRLKAEPHGIMIAEELRCTDWQGKVGHADGRISLWAAEIASEFERLWMEPPQPGLKLVGRRELRSINSWMHNVSRLTRSQMPTLLIHHDDAQEHAIADGDMVLMQTSSGSVEVVAELTRDIVVGTVSYPHGWGHNGSWNSANELPGENINRLAPRSPASSEQISGASHLDGVPVTIRRRE